MAKKKDNATLLPKKVDYRNCRHKGDEGNYMVYCKAQKRYRAFGLRCCSMFK